MADTNFRHKILSGTMAGCIFLFFVANMNFVVAQELRSGWKFKKASDTIWYPATVPGNLLIDLERNYLIDDPFYRDNEVKLSRIGLEDWEYQCSFDIKRVLFNKKNINLEFDGLDTYATVILNDSIILIANNMFRKWAVPVKNLLKQQSNILKIVFRSTSRYIDSIANNKLPYIIPDNSRAYARKAQYHFGWDWAPKLMAAGIWKPIRLRAYDWPEKEPQRIGLKAKKNNVELVQEKDSIGQSFYFKVNGKPVFIKGANWVPADVSPGKLTKTDYRKLLILAKEANINMLRVWGGGIYEPDEFYELCDELGIMVWQDMMFAGTMVPGDKLFIDNTREEILHQIKRLSRFSCIAVWCGNNEIDEAWKNWGWQKQFNINDSDSAKLWTDYKILFHDSIPAWIGLHDKRQYITTSPMHGWGRPQSMTEGDSHYWGVWWGLEPVEKYKEKIPRFMTEYGMQAMPTAFTINKFSEPSDRDTSSTVMKIHQKHPTGYQNIAKYIWDKFPSSKNFNEFVYISNVVQYDAIETAIASHIANQPHCMGTMLWQLNDCWPAVSWSIIDYYLQKKGGYYAAKKLYGNDRAYAKKIFSSKPLNYLQCKIDSTGLRIIKKGKHKLLIRALKDADFIYLYTEPVSAVQPQDNYFQKERSDRNRLPGFKKYGFAFD